MIYNKKTYSFFSFFFNFLKVIRIKIAFLVPTLISKLFLGLHECSYGIGFKVCGKVYFRPDGKNSITIGDNVTIISRFLTNPVGIESPTILECVNGGNITIGNGSGITSGTIISRLKITIGNNVNMGANVRIYDNDFHALDYLKRRSHISDSQNIKMGQVIIGDDVFIGSGAIILKGVHIGARSIIGAGSVVGIKNIPCDSIVFGNPAIIKLINI